MLRLTGIVFLLLVSTALPLQAALTGCAGGVQSGYVIGMKFDTIPTNHINASTAVCDASAFDTVETNGANVLVANSVAGPGVAAGAGLGLIEETVSITEVRSQAFIRYDFMLEKLDPTATDFAFATFNGEVLTALSQTFGQIPFTLQYVKREGSVKVWEEDISGIPRLINDFGVGTVNASIAEGAMAMITGEVDLFVGREYYLELEAEILLRGRVRRGPAPANEIGKLFSGFGIAVSGGISVPDGYALSFLSGTVPVAGVFPDLDSPLSLIPLPASYVLFASATVLLGAVRRRTNQH